MLCRFVWFLCTAHGPAGSRLAVCGRTAIWVLSRSPVSSWLLVAGLGLAGSIYSSQPAPSLLLAPGLWWFGRSAEAAVAAVARGLLHVFYVGLDWDRAGAGGFLGRSVRLRAAGSVLPQTKSHESGECCPQIGTAALFHRREARYIWRRES